MQNIKLIISQIEKIYAAYETMSKEIYRESLKEQKKISCTFFYNNNFISHQHSQRAAPLQQQLQTLLKEINEEQKKTLPNDLKQKLEKQYLEIGVAEKNRDITTLIRVPNLLYVETKDLPRETIKSK